MTNYLLQNKDVIYEVLTMLLRQIDNRISLSQAIMDAVHDKLSIRCKI